MRTVLVGKLVRDLVPDKIMREGKDVIMNRIPDANQITHLKDKLREEVAEFIEKDDPHELVDIIKVCETLALHLGKDREWLSNEAWTKDQDYGGFDKMIYLVSIRE